MMNSIQDFTSEDINREMSYYVFRKYEKDKKMGNVNLYKFLKFVITGDSNTNDISQICEIIGKKEVISRIKEAAQLSLAKLNENNKLFEEKKAAKRLLVSELELDKVKLIAEGNKIPTTEKRKVGGNKSLYGNSQSTNEVNSNKISNENPINEVSQV